MLGAYQHGQESGRGILRGRGRPSQLSHRGQRSDGRCRRRAGRRCGPVSCRRKPPELHDHRESLGRHGRRSGMQRRRRGAQQHRVWKHGGGTGIQSLPRISDGRPVGLLLHCPGHRHTQFRRRSALREPGKRRRPAARRFALHQRGPERGLDARRERSRRWPAYRAVRRGHRRL